MAGVTTAPGRPVRAPARGPAPLHLLQGPR
jgi:hypothetical protein